MTRCVAWLPSLACVAVIAVSRPCRAETDIRESVVKVFGTVRAPDLARPWSKQSPKEITGSGAVIDGHRILTNAHVVLYASQIFVRPYESSDKLPATVA